MCCTQHCTETNGAPMGAPRNTAQSQVIIARVSGQQSRTLFWGGGISEPTGSYQKLAYRSQKISSAQIVPFIFT